MDSNAAMTAGKVVRLAGVNRETLRFYESKQLLPKPGRTLAGYRLYPPDTVERLQFIQGAKSLGFSLKEIRALLNLENAAARPCDEVAAEAQLKLADVDRRIRDLQALRLELVQWIARCRAQGDSAACGPGCMSGNST
jgi:MerR family mercuric resistance operon transcriptional regulator